MVEKTSINYFLSSLFAPAYVKKIIMFHNIFWHVLYSSSEFIQGSILFLERGKHFTIFKLLQNFDEIVKFPDNGKKIEKTSSQAR